MTSSEDKEARIQAIRTILNLYPFSIGIFREILQNSEDAKASKQIFLLDCRVHSTATLRGTVLERTNGPALLAFNDSVFSAEDWEAITGVFRSSKRSDVSKIGKYGMGFRACFHVTDYPQVFSKDAMVMLDPQGDFFDDGVARLTLEDIPAEIRESLNLASFQSAQGQGSFPGTVIRLPLRTEHPGLKISTKTISCQEIEQNFQTFARTEMDICLLFLSSLQSVEFWVIREGETTPSRIALSSITPVANAQPDNVALARRVETTVQPNPSYGREWLIRWHSVPQFQDKLSVRVGCDVKLTMGSEKLVATVALAIQTGALSEGRCVPGKLFTYLPLPSDTNYPCNIHAPFALTLDRQTLRNEKEEGLIKGTADHIRVEWNRYLFDTVVPEAWTKLLLDLSKLNLSPFSVWPSMQHVSIGCSYWRRVPAETIRWIMDKRATVWPVRGPSTPPTYFRYDDVLIAPPTITTALLDVFASVGLTVTQPPQEVYDLVYSVDHRRILTPELAHAAILELDPPVTLDRSKRHHLLDYLLSTNKAENIIGIPLVEQVDGSIISLSRKTDASPNHVLLEEPDHSIFHKFDPHAILLTTKNLPSTALQLLRSTPLLDVIPLGVDHVVSYTDRAISYFRPLQGTPSGPCTQYISWVSHFFEWLQYSSLERVLHGRLREFPLLPTTSSELKSMSSGVFSANHVVDDGLVQLLQHLGLSLLHPGTSAPAQKYLDPYLKSLNNPHDVFISLPPLRRGLSDSEISSLQDYILSHKWTIQRDQVILSILRALPIYKHMVPSNPSLSQPTSFTPNYVVEWSAIPDRVIIRVVAPNITLLPIIPNTFFTSQLSLVQVFDQAIEAMSGPDILQLAINYFQSQPPELQVKFLEQLSIVHIPSTSLSHLKSIPFVLGTDGQLHAPQTLVDPTIRLASLLPPSSPHLPQYQTALQKRMVNGLKTLSLLLSTLTMEIFQEIVDVITSKQDFNLSNSLLDFLDNDTTSWSISNLFLNNLWLNTSEGLSSPANSRDHQYADLCNRVLPLLKDVRRIQSQKLLCALHWDIPPALPVAMDQFRALVKECNPLCPELPVVTSFLGSHLEELTRGGHLQELEQFVKGRSWVPTYGSKLTSTAFAVFNQDVVHPFKQITSAFSGDKDSRSFFQAMGCTEEPSEGAILVFLQDIGNGNTQVDEVVAFLRAIGQRELKAVLGSIGNHLPIIPTTDGVFKAHSLAYFNDMGPHADEVPLPPGYAIASDHIDRVLAQKLGLSFLSDRVRIPDDDLLEMKENLTTRITNVLHSYTKEQAFMEFLANAADAGATEFGITLDTKQYPPQKDYQFISHQLKKLSHQPSVILYNNGVFSPSDWKGICSIGTGSKQGNVDGKFKIGRFGLGALSMFYFTEVSMILSGCYVLFMDPRKAYLGRDRSCDKVSLSDMKRFFPAHLLQLHGQYGYDYSMDEYNGTLFKLHLRTKEQAIGNAIYGRSFSNRDIQDLITDFKRCAQHALFFVPIKKIEASYPGQHHLESWVVEKSTQDTSSFNGVVGIHYRHSSLQPKLEQWKVLFETILDQDIPSHFKECLSTHKIQTVSVGIAGALGAKPPSNSHRPFFGLPLPNTISLPIHLHCTFILSEDRRSIRYDERGEGNMASKFNKWLLTEKVPSLYFKFLAGWNHDSPMKECPWWPSLAGIDTISQIITEAMQTAFPKSNELICNTYSGYRIAPSKAHFLQPPCPEGLLLQLLPEDLTIIPSGYSLLPSPPLQNVDINYLTTILQSNAASITSMYADGIITVDDVLEVVEFLSSSPYPSGLPISSSPDLSGLPLLPLADETLALLSTEHTTFHCPSWQDEAPEAPWFPFPPHCFLDPRAESKQDFYRLLGVRQLDSTAISKLIAEKIPEQDTFDSSPDLEVWFDELWTLLDAITEATIEDPAFERLPLIPTHSPGAPMRISFQKLDRSSVLFIKPNTNLPLEACVALGMELVMARDCKEKLKRAIKSRKEQPPRIHRAIIGFFKNSTSRISECFGRLDHGLHLEFSRWFREQLNDGYYSLTDEEEAIVKDLPLWETIPIGRTPARFVSANTAVVIPDVVTPDMIRKWAKGSNAYVPTSNLVSLMKKPVDLPTFYADYLSFPPLMDNITHVYKSLLSEVLGSPNPRTSILVPNTTGRMMQSDKLYLSSNVTFSSAFALRRGVFLHSDLGDLEQRLRSWGLIDTISTSSFEACASAIHQDARKPGMRVRAQVVFLTYDTEMPPKLLADRSSQKALENLRFIPRLMDFTRYESIRADDYQSFRSIVSPSEVMDPKFVRVAWTQRAMCFEEPSPELRLVNDSVWKPTVREVIEHLHVLSQIGPDLPHNSELVEDLKATYSWLADHHDEAEGLLDYNQEKLFLNVDDPFKEWRWKSAVELLFDEKDTSNQRRVRQFLRGYSGLLRAAGVKEVNHVSVPDDLVHEVSHETELARITDSFNQMRQAGQLTDVTFIAEDGIRFSAHRVFLATRSTHFKTSFLGKWREDGEIHVEYSGECVGAVLDWLYKGSYNLPAEKMERLGILEEMYRLTHYWDFMGSNLFNDLTLDLIRLIGVETYDTLRTLTEDLCLEGGPLAEKCKEFEEKNRSVLAETD